MPTSQTANDAAVKHMRLIGHTDLGGYGNGGEGLALQQTKDGRRVLYIVPEAPPGSHAGATQMNDVYVDENRLIYAIDRIAGGLYILELTA